ncbi:glycerophosphodiester phosphodiesterase family protein [Actinomycetaceae bacterium MB13-C1-2]|nr:glycerophosphodiester phosphodiesterase family protein [Actinomycetaceae bacterium MB13-C1-2]
MVVGEPTAHVPTSDRIVFAHRGLNHRAPENTMPAFGLARDSGASWLEMDVDILGDGTPIVLHDTTLDRTTNRSGRLADYSAADLANIDAGSWFSQDFAGTAMPTFSQFIDFLNESKMNCNVELKSNQMGKAGTERLVDAVIAELDRLAPSVEIIISSFSALTLERFHERAPQYAIGMLWEQRTVAEDWLTTLETLGASYAHLEDGQMIKPQIDMLSAAGYGVNVWTVNSRARANQLFNWGCTGVFTDVADKLGH